MDGVTVEFGDPIAVHATDGIAGERGEKVAIGEHNVAGAEEGEDLALVAVGEIGGVDQGESGGREKLLPFAFGRGFLDEDGGIPLGEEDAIALEFEPALDEVDLGGLAGAIQPLDSDEFSRIIAFR